jgi:NAD-dependent histone deacetylase SIR2
MASYLTIDTFDFCGPYSYEYLEWALANCRRIAVVCGPGVSTAAGVTVRLVGSVLNALASCYGTVMQGLQTLREQLFKTRGGRTFRGVDLFARRALSDSDSQVLMNQKLAEHRYIAQRAPPTDFHILLDYLFHRGTLQRCYTENIDNLEGKLTPTMLTDTTGPAVVQLLGRNNEIRCETCGSIFDSDIFQTEFLHGVEVDCPDCGQVAGMEWSSRVLHLTDVRFRLSGEEWSSFTPGAQSKAST